MICLIPRLYTVAVFLLVWWRKCHSFVMKKFMLGCSFSFEAFVKYVGEKATKCSLKATEVLLNADGHVHTIEIFQGTVTPNCFKSHTCSWCPDFFQKRFCLMSGLKIFLSNITPFLPDNLPGLKKNIFRPGFCCNAWNDESFTINSGTRVGVSFA